MHQCEHCEREFNSRRGIRAHTWQTHPETLPWNNEERLEELYWDKGRSTTEIAELWNADTSTIVAAMRRHDIPLRTYGETQRIQSRRKPAWYRTAQEGYELWEVNEDGTALTVRVQRLAAVAWFGFEAVKNRDVHHKTPIPWLNAEWNFDLLERSEHISLHKGDESDDWTVWTRLVRDTGGER